MPPIWQTGAKADRGSENEIVNLFVAVTCT